jgi:hypothetical protein
MFLWNVSTVRAHKTIWYCNPQGQNANNHCHENLWIYISFHLFQGPPQSQHPFGLFYRIHFVIAPSAILVKWFVQFCVCVLTAGLYSIFFLSSVLTWSSPVQPSGKKLMIELSLNNVLKIYVILLLHNWLVLVNSKGFWGWCMALRITGFLDFHHHPVF